MAKYALLLLAIPFVELWLLFVIGGAIGFWPTVGLVIGMAVLGVTLAKHEGRRVLTSWQTAMATGQVPDEGITSGLLVLIGAGLLVLPGVLTDVVGLLLLLPPVRRRLAATVRAALERRAAKGNPLGSSFAGGFARPGVQMRVIHFGGSIPGGGAFWPDPPAARRRGGQVIDVKPEDYVVEEVSEPSGKGNVKGLLN
ncbi:FxsA family protein [Chondromyces crocatus]|uniref:Membrane protein, FxsA-like n=1 Tax=Chondromyces crocatus TaxID=52 RepID=A0A0K1ERP6_CHOCO|nr:FxsA family protein [Chondromyces crocatus]AKT43332.1 membrane protein, FxsA-like [Chondromyces crocatus]